MIYRKESVAYAVADWSYAVADWFSHRHHHGEIADDISYISGGVRGLRQAAPALMRL